MTSYQSRLIPRDTTRQWAAISAVVGGVLMLAHIIWKGLI